MQNKTWGSGWSWRLAVWLLVGLGGGGSPAQDTLPDWPSRALQLPSRSEGDKPAILTAVSLQPGSRLLATAGDDHLVYLWELTTGTELRRLEGHTDWVHTLAFSPDGKILASAGHDRQVIFWDADSGARRFEVSGPRGAVTKLAWSHDGQRLAATGFETQLRVYDVARRQLVQELAGPGMDLRALAVSPDDRWLAVGGRSGKIRVFQTSDFTLRREYAAHRQRIRALTFSPDSREIVSIGEDQRIHVQPLEGQSGTDLPPRPAKLLSLAFVGPEQLAVGGSDNLIRVWDLASGSEIGRLAGHAGSVTALASDHRVLVSGGYDTTVRIWTIQERVAEHPPRNREVKK